MNTVSLSFPDSTYTSSNKPSADTLKTDLSAVETALNANAASMLETTDEDLSSCSFFLDEDDMASNSATKVSSQQSFKAYIDAQITAVKAALYPVGSVYVNESVSTNPATLLGFGTWVAYGEGKVMVGKAGSGTFNTAGATGGAETVTLTGAQSGTSAHSHGVTDPGHTHSIAAQGSGEGHPVITDGTDSSINTNSATTGITINDSSEANADEAHTNLQPYVVCYMWKRSA